MHKVKQDTYKCLLYDLFDFPGFTKDANAIKKFPYSKIKANSVREAAEKYYDKYSTYTQNTRDVVIVAHNNLLNYVLVQV